VYNIKDKFRINKKKAFKGHNTAGYGCGLTMSPDGKYIEYSFIFYFVCLDTHISLDNNYYLSSITSLKNMT
jgi:hypothetical protein